MEGGDITNKNVEIEDLYDCIEVVEVEEEQKDPQKSMKRKRKLRSQVWVHFERLVTKNTNGETIVKAKCKYCEVLINSDSKYGTGNLKRHTINCVRKNTRDIGQMLIGGENGSMLMRSSKFSEEKFRELLISAIVMHNMPLSFVEYDGFRTVFSYLKDDVPTISRNTAKADMVKLHQREKNKIKFMLGETPGREVDNAVKKVRESAKYVKGSQVRKQKFLECVSLVSLNTKRGLRQDVPTRWNQCCLGVA
nr:zinc finger BED domain-containing protein RICESLEEPER 2-like [Ipomoea trifida]